MIMSCFLGWFSSLTQYHSHNILSIRCTARLALFNLLSAEGGGGNDTGVRRPFKPFSQLMCSERAKRL